MFQTLGILRGASNKLNKKKINSIFKHLTREKIEVKELLSLQNRRRILEENMKSEEEVRITSSSIINLISEEKNSVEVRDVESESQLSIINLTNVGNAVDQLLTKFGNDSLVEVEAVLESPKKRKRNGS